NAKQQKQILKKLETGEIDIVVGTHRLVQDDVKFKDLGLVVIDEEQRFGVTHKERFKQSFVNVDVLTLSATPIPRTLNMAMSGIRDMSVIDEPPQDRHPIQTYVIEHDMGIIGQAITKELRRGGQVYYIHNRIESIEGCAQRVHDVVPQARIGIAHGRMGEEELLKVWQQLLEKEIDILVCTTLIETGVDVQNCNTLIIEDADNMGLAQLYQLRGRVGRINRRAYAYFTFKRGKVLTEIAAKRLSAIREFTAFGSGFRIALRDMEIRGAGSILGARQHGHMESVGYDLYLRLLTDAVAEQKGEAPVRAETECLIDLRIDAHIPETYIESPAQRIDVYRKLASVRTREDGLDVIDELIDRYGEPPKSVTGLVEVALMRNMANALGMTEITQRDDTMLFFVEQPSIEQFAKLSEKFKGRVMLNSLKRTNISLRLKGEEPLRIMRDVLEVLSGNNFE
ncbi:MAG TPA: TRCF domain-containing protein, partial [Oscillospiraceae bacterium]|nr:TRCF domain-containing protein [Oscillospiraceae bacterium]